MTKISKNMSFLISIREDQIQNRGNFLKEAHPNEERYIMFWKYFSETCIQKFKPEI